MRTALLLAGASRCWLATAPAVAAAAVSPPPSRADGEVVRLFTPRVGVMASIISGAVIIGFAMSLVGSRIDAVAAALAAKLEERMAGVMAEVDAKLAGAAATTDAKVAGVLGGVPDRAEAAALRMLREYGVAVAGAAASK